MPRPVLRDGIALLVLLELIPIVHDVKTMLSAPYWLDEAWVALSVRFPLSDLPVTTASSPLGWSFLLRLVPDSDDLRVVPLVFHALAVVAAYAFGRSLRWPTPGPGIVAGAACALAVLLLPAQQVRHDLKQYSADAAVTLALLALASWTEQACSRRRLGVLTAVVAVGILISHVTAIVTPCVFAGLLLASAIRRQWLQFIEVALAGLGAGLIMIATYFGVSARGRNEAMQQFWDGSFPRVSELPDYLGRQLETLTPLLGAPALVVGALLVAGVVTLANRERPATATAVALLPPIVTALGVARAYPLLELRTSHFLLVTAAATAGLGVAGLAGLTVAPVRRGLRGARPAVVTAAVCAVLFGTYAVQNGRWYRFDGNESGLYYSAIAVTDVRSSTEYVARHRSANDVVVVNHTAWYGFAFYSTGDRLELVAPYGNTVGWSVAMPTRSDVLVVPNTDPAAIRAVLDQALERTVRGGPGARVWLIRSHVVGDDVDAWRQALTGYRVEQATDGVEPVLVVGRG